MTVSRSVWSHTARPGLSLDRHLTSSLIYTRTSPRQEPLVREPPTLSRTRVMSTSLILPRSHGQNLVFQARTVLCQASRLRPPPIALIWTMQVCRVGPPRLGTPFLAGPGRSSASTQTIRPSPCIPSPRLSPRRPQEPAPSGRLRFPSPRPAVRGDAFHPMSSRLKTVQAPLPHLKPVATSPKVRPSRQRLNTSRSRPSPHHLGTIE